MGCFRTRGKGTWDALCSLLCLCQLPLVPLLISWDLSHNHRWALGGPSGPEKRALCLLDVWRQGPGPHVFLSVPRCPQPTLPPECLCLFSFLLSFQACLECLPCALHQSQTWGVLRLVTLCTVLILSLRPRPGAHHTSQDPPWSGPVTRHLSALIFLGVPSPPLL